MEDLDRALGIVSDECWRDASDLAFALDGASAFASGLRHKPRGEEVLRMLGLENVRDIKAALTVERVPLATGFHHLRELPDARARARYLAGEVFPSRSFMRWWSPMARRGPSGLLAAYVVRWFFLVSRAPAGYLTYRRVARGAPAPGRRSG
jgi:hypothetical protein